MNADQFAAGHARDAIECGELLVRKGVIGIEQIEQAAIFANDRIEESDDFLALGGGQLVIELRKLGAVRPGGRSCSAR